MDVKCLPFSAIDEAENGISQFVKQEYNFTYDETASECSIK